MFKSKGVDVSPESVSGFITTFWGFLDANEEAVAMAKNNTVAQLKASEGFSGAVGLAVLATALREHRDELRAQGSSHT